MTSLVTRRSFLAGSLAGLAAPLAAEAQRRGRSTESVCCFRWGTPPILARGFWLGMRDRGWVENQGFVAEPRFAEGRLERLPELAAALVRLKVDVIVTMGTPATMAAKQRHGDHSDRRAVWWEMLSVPASCRAWHVRVGTSQGCRCTAPRCSARGLSC